MGYDMYRLKPGGESIPDDEISAAFLTDSYHRLNIWGMGEARVALEKIGIIRDGPMPSSPLHLSEEDVEAWRIASPGDGPGIPLHKFCSNDGWVVNPTEVRSGIKYADEHHPGWRTSLEPYLLEFVEWMEGSTAGFEVW